MNYLKEGPGVVHVKQCEVSPIDHDVDNMEKMILW